LPKHIDTTDDIAMSRLAIRTKHHWPRHIAIRCLHDRIAQRIGISTHHLTRYLIATIDQHLDHEHLVGRCRSIIRRRRRQRNAQSALGDPTRGE
jgi:hypothetical protein